MESARRAPSNAKEEKVETPADHEKVRQRPTARTPVPQPPRLKERAHEKAMFDNFYSDTPDIQTVIYEVENGVRELFSHLCFDLEPAKVAVYDEETVLIEFHGNDAALLIGKEGYRYKALSNLLYTWIHGRYGLRVRLEIAEFLQNQETMIEEYLQPIIERVEQEGRAQTKVLDGVLVQIALKRLREIFPHKYVAIRSNREGGRFVIINEFLEKR